MSEEQTAPEADNLYKLDENQTKALEDLLQKHCKDGMLWGYKNIVDPVERDIAARSEGFAEKLFARLYKSDPENAKLKWQEFTGKPADQGLMTRAKNTIVDSDVRTILPSLTNQQESVQKGVEKAREVKGYRSREEKISSLRGAMGDAEQRARDYGRRAEQGLVETDNEVSGLTLIKALWKGNRKIGDDFIASRNEIQKFKDMKRIMTEVRGGFEEAAVRDARSTVIGLRRDEGSTSDVAQEGERKNSGRNAAQAADNIARKNLAGRLVKMSGAPAARSLALAAKAVQRMVQNMSGGKQGTPETQQIRLLPAPGSSTPGRGI